MLTVKAQVKGYSSPDIADLEGFAPPDPECFAFLLDLSIGPAGAPGEERFSFVVATPRWFETHHAKTDVVLARHRVIVFEYDFPRLLAELTRICERVQGGTWLEIAQKLSHFGQWESATW